MRSGGLSLWAEDTISGASAVADVVEVATAEAGKRGARLGFRRTYRQSAARIRDPCVEIVCLDTSPCPTHLCSLYKRQGLSSSPVRAILENHLWTACRHLLLCITLCVSHPRHMRRLSHMHTCVVSIRWSGTSKRLSAANSPAFPMASITTPCRVFIYM